MTQPRILFLIPGLNIGGAERHTVDLRVRLEALGYWTGLIVHGRRRSEALTSHPGVTGAVFLDLKGMSDPGGWRAVWREFKRQSPDIIVAVNQMPLIVAIASRLSGATRARIVCVFHTTTLQPSEKRLFFLFRWALKLADALVFVSENQKVNWTRQRVTCRRTLVIPNGIDLGHFRAVPALRAEMRHKLGFEENDLVLGLVAAFRTEKNHIALINALAMVRARGIPAKALLVGDGPTRAATKTAAETLGVSAYVVYVGEQADVRPFIAASDVGVLCSLSETMPLSIIEFLASGVPVVMSRVGGGAEIVDNGVNGFLFDLSDPDAFVDRLTMISDRGIRSGLVSNASLTNNRFSATAMVKRYVALLAQLKPAGEGEL